MRRLRTLLSLPTRSHDELPFRAGDRPRATRGRRACRGGGAGSGALASEGSGQLGRELVEVFANVDLALQSARPAGTGVVEPNELRHRTTTSRDDHLFARGGPLHVSGKMSLRLVHADDDLFGHVEISPT